MASMAGGADAGYIFEEKFGITELKRDLDSMISKMDKENGLQVGFKFLIKTGSNFSWII